MRKHGKAFCARGMQFAWSGPVILAVIWMILQAAGVVTELTVNAAVLGILTTTVMVFVAAGVSIIYQIESLPKSFAALIHMAVLYVDYLVFYLVNGWLPFHFHRIWLFTLIFFAIFALIWLGIYLSIRKKVAKMNKALGK